MFFYDLLHKNSPNLLLWISKVHFIEIKMINTAFRKKCIYHQILIRIQNGPFHLSNGRKIGLSTLLPACLLHCCASALSLGNWNTYSHIPNFFFLQGLPTFTYLTFLFLMSVKKLDVHKNHSIELF